jgi:hypothetical protein
MNFTSADYYSLFGPDVDNQEQQRRLQDEQIQIEARIYVLTLQKPIHEFREWLQCIRIAKYSNNKKRHIFKNNVEAFFDFKKNEPQHSSAGQILNSIVQAGFNNTNLLDFISMALFLNKTYIDGIVKHKLIEVFYKPFGWMIEHWEIEKELLRHLVSQIHEWCPAELGEIRGESQFSKSRTLS